MVVPCARVLSVGEASAWGNQFLGALQTASVVEVAFEPSVEAFCKGHNVGNQIPILFVENSPDSKKWISAIRQSARPCILLWYGRGFTKEDLHFALSHRVYRVFENARADDKELVEDLKRVAKAVEQQEESQQVIHSLKSSLLQQGEGSADGLVDEIKAGLARLERGLSGSEFSGKRPGQGTESKVPFYKEQEFGDALATVHDLERTGSLQVTGPLPEQQGRVEFLQGKIVGAQVGYVRGLKAIYRIFLWDSPKFVFLKRDPDELELDEHLTLAMKYIRVEGEAFRERFMAIRRELPPGEIRLELEPNALHGGLRLPPDQFYTLSSVIEFGHVSRVLDFNPLPDVALYEALIQLKRQRLIRVAQTPVRAAA